MPEAEGMAQNRAGEECELCRAKGTVQFHVDEGIQLLELQEMSYRILRAKSIPPSAQREAGAGSSLQAVKGKLEGIPNEGRNHSEWLRKLAFTKRTENGQKQIEMQARPKGQIPFNSPNTDIMWATKQQVLVQTSPSCFLHTSLSWWQRRLQAASTAPDGATQAAATPTPSSSLNAAPVVPLPPQGSGLPTASQPAHCTTSQTSQEPPEGQLCSQQLPAFARRRHTHTLVLTDSKSQEFYL